MTLTGNDDLAITDNAQVFIGAAGKSYSWDYTSIAYGRLTTNLDNVLPALTTVNLGQNSNTASHLDLNNTSQTIGGVTVTSNSATHNTIAIDTGDTLTVNGDFIVGLTGTGKTTNLTASGGGTLDITGATVRIGVGNSDQNSTENKSTVDFTGLGAFNADVTDFLVGSRTTASAATGSRIRADLLLSDTANTITADLLSVGDSGTNNSSPAKMTLGQGTNTINANTIEIGLGKGNGTIAFDDPTGTVTIRGAAGGISATDIVVGQNTTVDTGALTTGLLDLDGHDADIIADSVTIADRTRTTNGVSGTVTVGSAGTTVSINTLLIADRTAGGTATGNYTQSGGTISVGTGTQDLIIGRNNSSAGNATGTMDVSGASSVTINVANVRVGLRQATPMVPSPMETSSCLMPEPTRLPRQR